jgi:NitT/TauT family transport system substrate-binding protein
LALGLLVGCTSSSKSKDSAGKSLDKVTYVTGFGSFGREAYAWYGLDKGYFRDEGIDLKITPGAGGDLNLKLLASNQAQFTAIDYAGSIVDVGKGRTDFKVISSIHQRTLIAIMALGGKGVASPQDLAGKTLGVATGAVPKTLFPAYAKLAGVPNNVKWVDSNPQALPQLLASGHVAGIGQFVVGAPAVKAAAAGAGIKDPQVVTLPYSQYMTDLYGNVLVTPTALTKSDPGLVKRFNKAYMKSLAASIADPTGTGTILAKYVPTQKPAVATAEVQLMKPYCGDTNELGGMDQGRVSRGIALIQSVGLIDASFDPEKLVDFGLLPQPNS